MQEVLSGEGLESGNEPGAGQTLRAEKHAGKGYGRAWSAGSACQRV